MKKARRDKPRLLPSKGPLPHCRFPAESFPHRTLQRRPGRLMNELHCMGRKERTRSRSQTHLQPADQSPRPAGGSSRPRASTHETCPSPSSNPCPGPAPGAGEKIKDTEAIGLRDPEIQNSGAGAAGHPQRQRADGVQPEPQRGAEGTRTWTRQVGEEWL